MQMRLTSLDILLLPMMLTSSGNGDSGFRHVAIRVIFYAISQTVLDANCLRKKGKTLSPLLFLPS